MAGFEQAAGQHFCPLGRKASLLVRSKRAV